MSNDFHQRFQDLSWYASTPQNIIVGGAGGIGSWLTLFLARIGHNIFLYDFDEIDQTNMGGQLYKTTDIGKNKAVATASIINEFCGEELVQTFDRYDKQSMAAPIMMTCFDNMQARKDMFTNWQREDNNPQIFIDGRLQAEYFETYLVTPERIGQYQDTLFEDDEVEELPCSAKATSHCGSMCASSMVAMLNNYLGAENGDFRALPFKFSLELSLFMADKEEELCTI